MLTLLTFKRINHKKIFAKSGVIMLVLSLAMSSIFLAGCSSDDKNQKGRTKMDYVKPTEICADMVSETHEFNDGYAMIEYFNHIPSGKSEFNGVYYVEGTEETFSHYACINQKGKVCFTDQLGLKDDEGNTFFVEHLYNYSHEDYLQSIAGDDIFEGNSMFRPEIGSDCYEDGCFCLLCNILDEDIKRDHYVCLVNEKGRVLKNWKLDIENLEIFADSDSDYPIRVFNNGNKTYWVEIDEGDLKTYYAISAEIGVLKEVVYENTHNSIIPLGHGYFQCVMEDSSGDPEDANRYVINEIGEIMSDPNMILVSKFVTDSLAVTPDFYYDVNTKKEIDYEAVAIKMSKGDSDCEVSLKQICDFSSQRDYAGFVATKYYRDGSVKSDYIKMDSNGKFRIISTFDGEYTFPSGYFVGDFYENADSFVNYRIFCNKGKYYSIDLSTGKTRALFGKEADKVKPVISSEYITVGALTQNNKNIYRVVNGNNLILPETIKQDAIKPEDNFIYNKTGFRYKNTLLTVDGVFDCGKWTPYLYSNGFVYTERKIDEYSKSHNILNADNKFLFK